MPKRAYLCKLELTPLPYQSWRAAITSEVLAQGNGVEIYPNWANEPNTSRGYHAICLVDSLSPMTLTDIYDLNIQAENISDCITQINARSVTLPSQAQQALSNAGFNVQSSLSATLSPVINHYV